MLIPQKRHALGSDLQPPMGTSQHSLFSLGSWALEGSGRSGPHRPRNLVCRWMSWPGPEFQAVLFQPLCAQTSTFQHPVWSVFPQSYDPASQWVTFTFAPALQPFRHGLVKETFKINGILLFPSWMSSHSFHHHGNNSQSESFPRPVRPAADWPLVIA